MSCCYLFFGVGYIEEFIGSSLVLSIRMALGEPVRYPLVVSIYMFLGL